jgi:hypothetical protein
MDGFYLVMIPNHFVCIEVSERKIYFCDNHTKEPMPAASSARLLQPVLAVYKIIKRPKDPVILLPAKYRKLVLSECEYCYGRGSSDANVVHSSYCEYKNRLLESLED